MIQPHTIQIGDDKAFAKPSVVNSYDIRTISLLLALCEGKPPVTDGFNEGVHSRRISGT